MDEVHYPYGKECDDKEASPITIKTTGHETTCFTVVMGRSSHP